MSTSRISERLRGLSRQRKALLTKIKQEQKQRERLAESVRDTMTAVMSQVQPLLVQREELSTAIHRLFRELLAEGRLAKSTRRKVEGVYRGLREALAPDPDTRSAPHDEYEEHEQPRAGASDRSFVPVGGATDNPSVRDVFRRLALALHPDRASNEEERSRRTEVMKQLTQAYQAGDLAALLEAEQRWLSGAQPTGGLDFDVQCSALERAIAALKEQLRGLRAEVKELKRSPELAMVRAMKRRARGAAADVLDEAVEEAEAEVQHLRELLNFVTAFRDGALSLAEFMRGPSSMQNDSVDVAELLFDFLDEEFAQPPRRAARRSGRARA